MQKEIVQACAAYFWVFVHWCLSKMHLINLIFSHLTSCRSELLIIITITINPITVITFITHDPNHQLLQKYAATHPPPHPQSSPLVKSSSGNSFSSSWPTPPLLPTSPGRAPPASSRWPTLTRLPGGGGKGSPSLTWTMTRWAGPWGIITTRTSWRRCMGSGTHTSSTFNPWCSCARGSIHP